MLLTVKATTTQQQPLLQRYGTTFCPLVIEEKGVFVRAIKSITVDDRNYYVAILQDAYAEQHLLSVLPSNYGCGGRRHQRSSPPVPIVIRGKIGLIPSDNFGLLAPFALPNVAYQSRNGQNNSMIFTVRQTLTNVSDHILHQ